MSKVDEKLLQEAARSMDSNALQRYVEQLATRYATGRRSDPLGGVEALDRMRIYAVELERRNEEKLR